jgi:sugar/nucleoside kinase (ribokinase family)
MKQARNRKKPKAPGAAFDVVTIGSATRDAFVKSRHFERRNNPSAPDGFDTCFPMGAKIPIESIDFQTGGGASNAAVTFARFGLKTACVSRIGNDLGGREILAEMKREKIDATGVQVDSKEHSAYSVILLAGSGHRAILVHRGAARELDAARIPWGKLRGNWLYLTSVGGDAKTLRAIFGQAKKSLARIAWNPGNAELDLGLERLLPWLMQTDVLILNRQEAAQLAACSPRDLGRILNKLGPIPRQSLVLTDGAHGAYAHLRGATWHSPALKGKTINTTGAGDAFGSAFVAAIIKHGDAVMGLKTATLNAHGVVTHMGAKAGILAAFPGKSSLSKAKASPYQA